MSKVNEVLLHITTDLSSDFKDCYLWKVSKHKALSILVAMGSRVFNFLAEK